MGNVLSLSPPAGEPVVDLDALEALAAALGADLCLEVVEDGILRATERLVIIERALPEEDWGAMLDAARELAGIAARIGLSPLAARAEALEACCLGLDRVACHAVAARLLRTGEAAIACAGADPGR